MNEKKKFPYVFKCNKNESLKESYASNRRYSNHKNVLCCTQMFVRSIDLGNTKLLNCKQKMIKNCVYNNTLKMTMFAPSEPEPNVVSSFGHESCKPRECFREDMYLDLFIFYLFSFFSA